MNQVTPMLDDAGFPMKEWKLGGDTVPILYDPLAIINRAVSNNADVGTLEKLMALYERWQANQARQAFDNAMASAKAEIPLIAKNREVDFTSQKGRTNYRYEDLGEVVKTITPALAKHGLSHRFRTSSAVGEPIVVTCVISHRGGHSEENTLIGPRDDSGNKNSLQQIGSTLTYLQRMTLKAALGLAATADDDGVAAGAAGAAEPISEEQLAALIALADDVNADKKAFCEFFKIGGVAELPAKRLDEATKMLNKKKGKT